MMAGDKNCNFTLCKTSQIGTFHKVVRDVSSFQNKKPKQTVEPAQYGLETNFNACVIFEKKYCF